MIAEIRLQEKISLFSICSENRKDACEITEWYTSD